MQCVNDAMTVRETRRAPADAELLQAGAEFEIANAREQAAWAPAELENDDDGPATRKAQSLNEVTGDIVDRIKRSQATTLAGVMVKIAALAWCRTAEPLTAEDLMAVPGERPTTDRYLISGIIRDLDAMRGRQAAVQDDMDEPINLTQGAHDLVQEIAIVKLAVDGFVETCRALEPNEEEMLAVQQVVVRARDAGEKFLRFLLARGIRA